MQHTISYSFTLRVCLFVIMCASAVNGMWAQTTYQLKKVTSIEVNKFYVFEQDGYVMNNSISSSALQCTNKYKTTGLSGTETYVWQVTSSSKNYIMRNVNQNNYLGNTSSTNLSWGTTNHIWAFKFQQDGTVIIQNVKNSDRFLGFTSASSHEYKAYATSNLSGSTYPHAINVFQLFLTYARTVTIGNYGTICLPYAVANGDYSGAIFYTIAGKKTENDELKYITLEEVSSLEAGKPYIFKATATELLATYSGNAVAAPVAANGMIGTFTGGSYVPADNYVLKSGVLYKTTTEWTKTGANKAYITLEGISEVESEVKGVRLFTDITTHIEGEKHDGKSSNNIYNPSGLRLRRPSKGINIVNGKKYIVK